MVIPTSSGRHKALEVPPHRFQKHQFNLISNLADLLEIKEYIDISQKPFAHYQPTRIDTFCCCCCCLDIGQVRCIGLSQCRDKIFWSKIFFVLAVAVAAVGKRFFG